MHRANKNSFSLLISVLISVGLSGCATAAARHAKADLPHFSRVNERLYRGGQPSRAGLQQLAQMGVKTIINLREENRSAREEERRLVQSLGMHWIYLPMRAYWKPSDRQMRDFFSAVTQADNQPVFLHCRRGRDRAGVMVAAYRVVINGWDPKQAYEEALSQGMTRWNPWLKHVIFTARKKYAEGSARKNLNAQDALTIGGGG